MKTELWMIGRTEQQYLTEGLDIYAKRIKHYIPFDLKVVPLPASGYGKKSIRLEAELVLKNLKPDDHLILLDESGEEFNSKTFAQYIQKLFNSTGSRIVFLIGGPYGFDKALYDLARQKVALSRMTLPHDLCRLVFLEQFYRALTILNNHPYQH
jgi:23S rRNA (pseudouridine1915-N3)-methyltransferase